ncbi:hypothetical protein SGF_03892 [Shigella flexneri CDC 796-83]|uniref:Uncharacterized protein n=1 Tax=Shigella flexneri CDC 796-83 TaxID=945360 RepID=A0A6N3QN99_SHIFL|nr:hypothetical protein SGF_03892 [Shigella flexneri CDC 796-83]
MKARSVRVAGIEIIDSVKTVAFVFTETLLFMVWWICPYISRHLLSQWL